MQLSTKSSPELKNIVNPTAFARAVIELTASINPNDCTDELVFLESASSKKEHSLFIVS